MKIGFSTGSVALNDVRRGIDIATHTKTNAIELSALREQELVPLLRLIDKLQNELSIFEYIAFHAPSKREKLSEEAIVSKLKKVADLGWAIIVHPDAIENFELWKTLGRAVCIENMDKRKATGRTAAQLKPFFDQLPEATFCFDIGHARQIDPTMLEAETMLREFHGRLRQVHMSYVNSQSQHERLNYESILAYQRVAHWIDNSIPIILETPVEQDEVVEEISLAKKVFELVHLDTEEEPQNHQIRN
ncbi:hypothetical protein [uncultured Gimesia sp.]|uniref:hypothetical protein n=1 Tax=uncultured Gimesia sp. TaxID=1678688 RepID=UPI0026125D88|nr:hypothetical protein [uncultured Gimesia sp.]